MAGSAFFHFPDAKRHDPLVDAWLSYRHDELRQLARFWFARIRECGADVRELMHDGWPTACAGDAAFAYVSAHKAHVNVGFYYGADLADPAQLLEGAGRSMRHVKLRWGAPVNEDALSLLIVAAYDDIRARLTRQE